MPRAALLSIHARVEGTEPSTWEDPSLVQLWGPRYQRVRRRGARPRGLLAREAAGRCRAPAGRGGPGRSPARPPRRREDDLRRGGAARSANTPIGSGTPHRPARSLIRWDGARQPTIWTVPPPEVDPRDARLELARRYLHIFGPTTPEAFAEWAGIAPAARRRGVRRAPQVADPGADTDRRRVDPHPRRADVPRRPRARGARAAPPERRRLLPPPGSRSRAPGPRRRPSWRALDLSRLAGCASWSRARSSGRGDARRRR